MINKLMSIVTLLGVTFLFQQVFEYSYMIVIALVMWYGYVKQDSMMKCFGEKEGKWKNSDKHAKDVYKALKGYLKTKDEIQKNDDELRTILNKLKEYMD